MLLILFSIIKMAATSGVKRARMTLDEEQPSVHVIYNSLTRLGLGVFIATKKRKKELYLCSFL